MTKEDQILLKLEAIFHKLDELTKQTSTRDAICEVTRPRIDTLHTIVTGDNGGGLRGDVRTLKTAVRVLKWTLTTIIGLGTLAAAVYAAVKELGS